MGSGIEYQGTLTNPEGLPVSGSRTMRFLLYDAASGGSEVWDSGNQTVNVTNGLDASYGAIAPGDLLTASPTPGHAKKAKDPQAGTIVGRALDGLDTGTGAIPSR